MNQRLSRPRLEHLGSRILPSASPLPQTAAVAHAALTSLSLPVVAPPPLAGHGHGAYSYDPIQSGAGIEYRLHGTADVAGMGRVEVAGSAHAVGFIRNGRAGGELTLRNAHGSVTLELVGPTQPAYSPLPEHFHYRVVKATGAYAEHLGEGGSLGMSLKALPTGDRGDPHGTFGVTFSPTRPPRAATGIEGVALVGPTSPVARPGVPNERPLAGAIITVRPVNGGAEIARVVADARGRFELDLPPGRYEVVPLPPGGGTSLPRATPGVVVVRAEGLTRLVVKYDSGTR